MEKKKLNILRLLVVFLIGGLTGFLAGAGYSGSMMKSYILDSDASWLNQHVLRLAMLRNGNVDACIESIEETLDNSILQIGGANRDKHGQIDPSRLPRGHLAALQTVRVYTDAGYSIPLSDDSVEIVSGIQPLDGEFCSPDLRALQKQASDILEP